MTIKNKVRELLTARGMTQKELSARTGISELTVSEICRNRREKISIEMLCKIAKVLNVEKIKDIIEFEE